MNGITENQRNVIKRIIYWSVIILITLSISKFFLDRFPWKWPHSDIDLLMNGTAERPYVYRILVPFLIKMAINIYPLSATVYASLLTYFSLLGFVICIRSFSALFWESTMIVDAIGLTSPVLLLPLMLWNEQIYDFTTLLLFSLGLLYMAQAKWKLFFLIYMISCLNKETTVLLLLVFFVCFWHRRKDAFFWKIFALQLAIYVTTRFAIIWKFQSNPGGIVENHFWDHVVAFQTAPTLVLTHIFLGILIMILAIWDQKKKPFFLKRAAIGLVPVLFTLYLLWGFPLEIRVFYEAYPVILLLALPTTSQLLGLPFWSAQRPYVDSSRAVLLYESDKLEYIS